MTPAIKSGSVLIVNKLSYGLRLPFSKKYLLRWAAPRKGDVLVFKTPQGVLAVKRCAFLTEDGRWFAAGDNILLSFDSRSYGPVPIDSIIGRAAGFRRL